MPLPGGPTDKFGNRYEGRWTVFCMIEVMREHTDSIRLEPPGVEGEGVEFWVRRGNQHIYHQVKRQQSGTGRWTLGDLQEKRVLSNFWQKLAEKTAQCMFISTHAPYQLENLIYQAKSAASFQEFESVFFNTKDHHDAFQSLLGYWPVSRPEDAREALKRITVRTEDEDTLLINVESHLEYLVDGNPATIRCELADFALDNVHAEITAHNIWSYLETLGHRRRHWDNDPHIIVAAQDATTRYLSTFRDALINGQVIPRDAASTILDLFTQNDGQRCVLISGEAGAGKSSTILQVIQGCREQNWPLLALRADRLHSTQLPKDIGQQIGLPGSPANVLAAIAHEQDCLLVIDQLDAVSLTSGRHPELFDCLFELIRQAMSHQNMRILLACRKFDLEYDSRLRRLTEQDKIAHKITLSRLTPAQVQQIVTALGLDAQQLTAKQFGLLSIPLHLRLLEEIVQDASIRVVSFETAKDLFDHYWEVKQRKIRERLNHDIHWATVIDALAEYMSTHQTLVAPLSIVDSYQADTEAMESEHILARDGKSYAFFHESFFDYAFARRFVAQERRLVDLLISGEQHLFRRAQMRQILLHEREATRQRYLADLRALLTDSRIRFHMKPVIFALLAELHDPTEQEWRIIAQLMNQSGDSQTHLVWRMFANSLPWCSLLDSTHTLERWLSGSDQERAYNVVLFILPLLQKHAPDRVVELLEPHIEQEIWSSWLVHFMQVTNVGSSRRFFSLFLRLLDGGTLDGLLGNGVRHTNHFWTLISSLPQTSPEWACKAIKHYFDRLFMLKAGTENAQESVFLSTMLPDISPSNGVLMQSAQAAPEAFVKQLLPLMLQLMESRVEKQERVLKRDSIWKVRHSHGGHTVYNELLRAMERALRNLSLDNPGAFTHVAQHLRVLPFETVQYLLLHAFSANGERWADGAADYICERPELLQIGYIDAPYWVARQLVEAISPYCSDEQMQRLELTILAYYPENEKQAQGMQLRGYLQFTVLDGIVPERRTPAVIRRLEEWKRKFGRPSAEGPSPQTGMAQASRVQSPLPPDAIEKMTDEQWLRAIAHYHQDELSLQSNGIVVGGLPQIARQLESQAKREPRRFAQLVHQLPDDTHPDYFQAILRGVTDTALDMEIALDVCRRCHRLPTQPCGRAICDFLASIAPSSLPNDVLDMVAWYATEDSDPTQELWHTDDQQSHNEYSDTILTAGVNSVRGRAVEVIGELIFSKQERAEHFFLTLEHMVQDPSISVRACVAKTLWVCATLYPDSTLSLFQQLCETDEALLQTGYIEHFLAWAARAHLEAVLPIIERMLSSEKPTVAIVGARVACIASLLSAQARPLAARCLVGTDAQRRGAATVFALHLCFASLRSQCEEALLQLFQDTHEQVQEEAVKCFSFLKNEELGDYAGLVEAFVKTPAFRKNPYYLLTALKQTTARCPELIYLVCKRCIDALQSEEVRSRPYLEPPDAVSQLIIRAYSQSMEDMDEALQAHCLDVIDVLSQIGTTWINQALNEYDR